MKKLPIGTQSFEKLRKEGAIYVDKTEYIYNLISKGSVYFLSRPRRFGKSLLISTFKELFKGNKEIFEGLYIWDKWDWGKKYPVIHLDFTELGYKSSDELEISLNIFLDNSAKSNKVTIRESAPVAVKFAELIEKLNRSTGQQAVILIDEYDKPMIDSLEEEQAHKQIKKVLHNFYQVIKGSDEHIKFMFMTGVSRFAGLSVFSALNNLYDITMDGEYSAICGYTQEELESSFKEYIGVTAEYMGISKEEMLKKIKYWYNGYSWDGKVFVYNPFSTLAFFKSKEFVGYWYETGTPTFLIEQVEKMKEVESLIESQKVSREVLKGSDNEEMEVISLMFQTGYLTIKEKEIEGEEAEYTIDFPNNEVKKAFLTRLVAVCARKSQKETEGIRNKINESIEKKEAKGLEESLVELYANIPYELHIGEEKYYHSMFLLTMRLIGYEVEGEVHTDKGRADVVLRKGERVIVVEIKYSKGDKIEGKVKEAMEQIRGKKYYEKYIKSNPVLLGIVFSEDKGIGCKFEMVKIE
jgi:Holliday junction resolvase-like predicted endonuclease